MDFFVSQRRSSWQDCIAVSWCNTMLTEKVFMENSVWLKSSRPPSWSAKFEGWRGSGGEFNPGQFLHCKVNLVSRKQVKEWDLPFRKSHRQPSTHESVFQCPKFMHVFADLIGGKRKNWRGSTTRLPPLVLLPSSLRPLPPLRVPL